MVEDFSTSLVTDSAFWQAASSCIVPMTLTSFITVRPPALPGCGETLMCTTVSTFALAMTFEMTGLRMSARTNSVAPRSRGRRHDVDADDPVDAQGSCVERGREPPAEVTGDAGDQDDAAHAWRAYFLLRRWTRVFLSSLRCFFFAMRLRRFLMTEPTSRPLQPAAAPDGQPGRPTLPRGAWRPGARPPSGPRRDCAQGLATPSRRRSRCR